MSSYHIGEEFGRELKIFFFNMKTFVWFSSFPVLLQKHCILYCQNNCSSVKNFWPIWAKAAEISEVRATSASTSRQSPPAQQTSVGSLLTKAQSALYLEVSNVTCLNTASVHGTARQRTWWDRDNNFPCALRTVVVSQAMPEQIIAIAGCSQFSWPHKTASISFVLGSDLTSSNTVRGPLHIKMLAWPDLVSMHGQSLQSNPSSTHMEMLKGVLLLLWVIT